MPTITAGSVATVYCPLASTITITPGSAGRVSFQSRSQTGGQSAAPREMYAAESISVNAGDTVTIEAINTDATYTTPAGADTSEVAVMQALVSAHKIFSVAPSADPTGVADSTAAFQAAAAALSAAGGGVFYVPLGSYIVKSTTALPANSSIYFEPGAVVLPRAGGTFTANAVFTINSADGATWTTPFPNTTGCSVENLFVSNAANPSLVVGALISGACLEMVNCRTSHCHFTMHTVSEYLDKVAVRKCYIGEPQGSEYQINLKSIGDGGRLEQIHAYHASAIPKAVRIGQAAGCVVAGCIGGDYLLSNCAVVTVLGMHNETGTVEFASSGGNVQDSYFWVKSTVSIKCSGTGGKRGLHLRNNRFIWNNNAPPASASAFDVEINDNTVLLVEDCYRQCTLQSNLDIAENGGIFLRNSSGGIAAWNDHAWRLSQRGRVNIRQYVDITGKVPCGTAAFTNTLSGATTAAQAGTWQLASGTYYYQQQLILDRTRYLGRGDSGAIVNVATTLGGNGVLISINWQTRHPQGFLRVYRGTSSGSYNAYCDLPAIATRILYDNGEYLNGYPWVARGAAGMDSVSLPGEDFIEWNGVTATWTGTVAPTGTLGTMIQGDKIIHSAPAASGTIGLVCTTGAAPGTGTWKTYGAIAA